MSWSYEEMSRLNSSMVCHVLNMELEPKPIKQPNKNFNPELEAWIKEEMEKLIATEFIKLIKHRIWLANIVPVKKKND